MPGAALGDLVVSLTAETAKFEAALTRAAYLADQRLGEVAARFDKLTAQIEGSIGNANKAMEALAIGFLSFKTIDAFAENIHGAIEAAAQLDHLSLKTGAAVESLSALRGIAKLSGTDLNDVGTGLEKLAKSMVETERGTGKAKAAFDAMGLSVTDAKGQLKTTDAMMLEVAQKLASMENQTLAVAYAQQIFGKAGANLLPVLHDLAEVGALNGKITAEQASQARAYEITIAKLDSSKRALYTTIAFQVLPAMDAFAKAVLQARTEVGGLNDQANKAASENKIREWAISAGIAVSMLIDGVRYVIAGIELVGRAVVLVGAGLVTGFRIASDAVNLFYMQLENAGQLLRGVALVMSGQFMAGAMLIKGALHGVTSDWGVFVSEAKTKFGEFSDVLSDFQGDFAKMATEFAKDSFVDKFLDGLIKLPEPLKKVKTAVDDSAAAHKAHKDALDGLVGALDQHLAKLRAEYDSMSQYGMVTKETTVATTAAALKNLEATGVLGELAKGYVGGVAALKAWVTARAGEVDAQIAANGVMKEYIDAMKKLSAETAVTVQHIVDEIKAERDKIETLGMSAAAITKHTIAKLEDRKAQLLVMDGTEKYIAMLDLEIAKLGELAAVQGQLKDGQNQLATWNQIASTGAQMFTDWAVKGKSAIDVLRTEIGNLWRDLVALFARRWILQLGATLLGGSAVGDALAAAVGQAGAGTIAGSIASSIGTYLGGTSIGSYLGFGAAAPVQLAGPGMTSAALQGGASGSTAMPAWLGTAAWVGAIVAGMYANNQMFSAGWRANNQDSTANTLGFASFSQDGLYRALGLSDRFASFLSGSSLTAAIFGHGPKQTDAGGISGSFTDAGVMGQNWQDWTRKGGWFRSDQHGTDTQPFDSSQADFFKQAMAPISAMVAAMASSIGVNPSNALAGYSQDFKLDFKGKTQADISTMIGNLLGSVLQEQTARLFDTAGRTQVAEYVRGLKGAGDQITATIQQLYGVMTGITALNAKGLSVEALMAWQQQGESLTQTFQRVAGQFAQFDAAFSTSAQKMQSARDYLTATFNSLGVAIPTSIQGFYNLVHGIDLSTEAGRHMFDVLMQVAPAFQTVSNAAAQTLAQFYQIAGGLSSSFGQQYAKANLDAAAQAWLAVVPGAAANGWDIDKVINEIAGLIAGGTSNNPAGFSNALGFAQGLGGNALDLFNSLLSAYAAWKSAANSGGSVIPPPVITSINNLGNAAASTATALAVAQAGIADWLTKTKLNPQLSTLNPGQKFDLAQQQYIDNLMAAQHGDVGALSKFTALADAYLQEARSYLASSGSYSAIFNAVTGQAAGLAGLAAAQRPLTAADFQAGVTALVKAVRDLQSTVSIGQAAAAKAQDAAGAVAQRTTTQLTQAINDGSLSF